MVNNGRVMMWAAVPVCCAWMAVLALSADAAYAADAKDPAKAAYLKYCSACHGADGKGDGVAAVFLRPKPTDLTELAKNNKGDFPFMKVAQSIDGTETIGAHGERGMPVWGEVFREEGTAPMVTKAQVRGKALLITQYVESLQAK